MGFLSHLSSGSPETLSTLSISERSVISVIYILFTDTDHHVMNDLFLFLLSIGRVNIDAFTLFFIPLGSAALLSRKAGNRYGSFHDPEEVSCVVFLRIRTLTSVQNT